ncbi:hypothetical protein KP509_29G065000 [Ceratopteris richardii]|uniref:Transmembrane protein n=1 Tax=Ceratopteris richardii TaxID=49495 RepID=A0A8T2R8L0_CERRI|nr:hypothetical protein KP509_29G065000 [Ceratopteris richardii]
MVRPPIKREGLPSDEELVSFINDFLFNHHNEQPSSPRLLQRQRTPTRSKRYRGLWKAAASSLSAKRTASQMALLDSLGQQQRGRSMVETCSSSSFPSTDIPSSTIAVWDGYHASSDSSRLDQNNDNCSSTAAPSRDILSSATTIVHSGGGCSQSDETTEIEIEVDAASLLDTRRDSCKDQPFETLCTRAVPKSSSRKPPRPPRVGVLRSSSLRGIRLKSATRRAVVDPIRRKKQKANIPNSNAAYIWALIVTISFVVIMLVQGFFGDSSMALSNDADDQRHGVLLSLSPSQINAPESMPRSLLLKDRSAHMDNPVALTKNSTSFPRSVSSNG